MASASFTIYHNPRCSKSRQTLALLQENGVEPEIIEYLQTPPDTNTLQSIKDMLDVPVRGMMRTKEASYKEANLGDEQLSDADLLQAMHDNPILIERPIVISGKRAVIGRPPENVLDLL